MAEGRKGVGDVGVGRMVMITGLAAGQATAGAAVLREWVEDESDPLFAVVGRAPPV
jgi:hypothetical protein